MAQLAADGYSSLNFPVNLNRVTLCGGDIIYLLDEELALLEGNYIADQVITIGSSFQTFTIRSNAAATGGGNSGETHLDIPDLFGMEIHYYDPNTPLQAPAQYNGNIAWTKWQVRGREAQYYGYRYDELDRLKRATFGEDWRDQGMLVTNKYTVDSHVSDNLGPTIQYDKRGNIEHLRRRGGVGGCSSELGYSWDTVDQLDYSYNGQNQLTSLTDANELAGGIRYNYSEMEYDQNGNLTKDSGKNISQIDYNYLNLPDKITFNSGDQENTIEWTYDAKGNKLVKRVNGATVKEYLPSGVEYDGDKIEAIYHAEGRAIPMYNPVITGLIDSFRYEYVLQDHLGNGRVYFSDLNEDSKIQVGGIDNEVMQENHYYPFGLNHEGPFQPQQPVENAYQYNGKELNEEFGLGWNDYGARFYDPAVGRFTSVDRFAEKYYAMTPYQYGANNPITNIDINGDSIIVLSAAKSVHGAGHAAVLIGNENDGWRFYSKNGTTKSSGTTGPSDGGDAEGVPFKTLEDFANSEKHNINSDGSQVYTEGYLIKSNASTDAKMKTAALKNLDELYDVMSNNCIDMCSRTLEAGEFEGGTDRSMYSNVEGNTFEIQSQSPIPNVRYRAIKRNNQGGTIISGKILKPSPNVPKVKKAMARKERFEERRENYSDIMTIPKY